MGLNLLIYFVCFLTVVAVCAVMYFLRCRRQRRIIRALAKALYQATQEDRRLHVENKIAMDYESWRKVRCENGIHYGLVTFGKCIHCGHVPR